MKARVFEIQADLFEVAVLSQTAQVLPVSMDQILTEPSGAPVVIVGGLLKANRLGELRTLASALGRARAAVIVVPPFTDPDLGRYFETPVQLHAQRRGTESMARILDAATAETLGDEVKVRSDHEREKSQSLGICIVPAIPDAEKSRTLRGRQPFAAARVGAAGCRQRDADQQSVAPVRANRVAGQGVVTYRENTRRRRSLSPSPPRGEGLCHFDPQVPAAAHTH